MSRTNRTAVMQPQFLGDLREWLVQDRKLAVRALDLMDAVLRDPFTGVGKPEPLRHLGPDVWSRRIDQRHRLVYVVYHDRIDFLHARYHY